MLTEKKEKQNFLFLKSMGDKHEKGGERTFTGQVAGAGARKPTASEFLGRGPGTE